MVAQLRPKLADLCTQDSRDNTSPYSWRTYTVFLRIRISLTSGKVVLHEQLLEQRSCLLDQSVQQSSRESTNNSGRCGLGRGVTCITQDHMHQSPTRYCLCLIVQMQPHPLNHTVLGSTSQICKLGSHDSGWGGSGNQSPSLRADDFFLKDSLSGNCSSRLLIHCHTNWYSQWRQTLVLSCPSSLKKPREVHFRKSSCSEHTLESPWQLQDKQMSR